MSSFIAAAAVWEAGDEAIAVGAAPPWGTACSTTAFAWLPLVGVVAAGAFAWEATSAMMAGMVGAGLPATLVASDDPPEGVHAAANRHKSAGPMATAGL